MAAKYYQISLNDIFSDCQIKLTNDSPAFFQLLAEHFELNDFIPPEFHFAFYRSIGRNRVYPLHGFLTAFILQKTSSYSVMIGLSFPYSLRQPNLPCHTGSPLLLGP